MVTSTGSWRRERAARAVGVARALLPAALACLALATAAASAAPVPPPPGGLPDWSLRCADGTTVRFQEALARGPVLVGFWALWCGPCLKELPHLDDLARETAGRLTVLAVNQDGPRSVAKVRPYLQAQGLRLRVPLDTAGDVSRKLQVGGVIPFVLLYDAQGREVYRHVGYREGDEQQLRERVLRLLAGKDAGDAGSDAAGAETLPRGEASGDSAREGGGRREGGW